MQSQKLLIKKFQKTFPDLTIRQASTLTGIQVSRLFRIYNGYEMKVSEYEKLKELIATKDPEFNCEASLQVVSNIRNLKPEQLNQLARDVQYFIMHNSFAGGSSC